MALRSSIDIDQIVVATVDADPTIDPVSLPDGSLAVGIDAAAGGLWQKMSGGSSNWSKFFQLPPAQIVPASGRVIFSNGTNLIGDNGFFWDNVNKRLGIGTTTPASTFHNSGSNQDDVNTILITSSQTALNPGEFSHIHIINNTASTNLNIDGITGGRQGRKLLVTLTSNGTGNLTIRNDNTGAAAQDRLILSGLTNYALGSLGITTLEFVYSTAQNRWVHTGGRNFQGTPVTHASGAALGRVAIWNSAGTNIAGFSNFFWDSINNRLGVNQGTPLSNLHVEGSVRLNLGSDATGDMFYRGSGSELTRIPLGSNGQLLHISSGIPTWQSFDFTTGYTTYDSRYLQLTGGTLTNFLTLHADPTNSLHAATKSYVDNAFTNNTWKEEVVIRTATNITLSGLQTLQSISLLTDDRVLVGGQTDPTENGIYLVKSGAWVRSLDADTGAELAKATVFVGDGTFANTQWACSNITITLGTTNITFVQIAGAGTYTNGSGLDLTGNVFSVSTNGISNSMIRQSVGTSILGRSTNTIGDVADIQSTSDNQILIRRSGSLSFTTLLDTDIPSLDTSKITTGVLPISRGGTNSGTSLNNNRIIISSGGALVEQSEISQDRVLFTNSNGLPTGTSEFVWDNTNKRLGINLNPSYSIHTSEVGANPNNIGGIVSSAYGNGGSGTATLSTLRYGSTNESDAGSYDNLGQLIFAGLRTDPRVGASIITIMDNWNSSEFPTRLQIRTVLTGSGALTDRISLNTNTTTQLHDLSGIGNRVVQVDSNGVMSATVDTTTLNSGSDALMFSLIY